MPFTDKIVILEDDSRVIFSAEPCQFFMSSSAASTTACAAAISPSAKALFLSGSEMFMACCVATGSLLVDRPDHSMCGISHPELLALLSRQLRNTRATAGSGDAAGPENVRQASICSDLGLSTPVRLLYAK
jgi:hypothetical protein